MMYIKASDYLKSKGVNVQLGKFGAHMEISYINDGPVTFFLDSAAFGKKS